MTDPRFAGSRGNAVLFPREPFFPAQIRSAIALLGMNRKGFADLAEIDLQKLTDIMMQDARSIPMHPAEWLLIGRTLKSRGVIALPSVRQGSGVRWSNGICEADHGEWLKALPADHRVTRP